MLLFLDSRVEGLRRVVGQNGHPGLRNDRAGIHSSVHPMNGAAGFGNPRRERLSPGFEPGELWEERRVDVDDPFGNASRSGALIIRM